METNRSLYLSIIAFLIAVLITQAIAFAFWSRSEPRPINIKIIHRHYNAEINLPDKENISNITNEHISEYVNTYNTTNNMETTAQENNEEPKPEEINKPKIPETPEEIIVNEDALYAFFYKDGELHPVECCHKDDLEIATLNRAIERSLNFLLIGNNDYQTYIPEGTTYAYLGSDYSGNFKMYFSEEILSLKGTPEASLAVKQIVTTANWAYKVFEDEATVNLQFIVKVDGILTDIYEALELEE